jgi:hypothetical protein
MARFNPLFFFGSKRSSPMIPAASGRHAAITSFSCLAATREPDTRAATFCSSTIFHLM